MTESKEGSGRWVLAGLIVLALLGFVTSFVVATREMSLFDGLRDVAGSWWGIVTLADLGAGLLFVALWISLLERRVWPAVGWIVALGMLGNVTTLAYLLVRCVRTRSIREAVLGAPSCAPRERA